LYLLVVGLPLALVLVATTLAFLTVRLDRRSGDRLRARRAEQPLCHELPYWSFFDDAAGVGIAVHVDLTYSSCLELSGVDTDCLDAEGLNHITSSLHNVIQNVPAGVVLQFVYETHGNVTELVSRYRVQAEGREGIGAALIRHKADDIAANPHLRRSRLLLSIALPPDRGVLGSAGQLLRKSRVSLTPALHEDLAGRLGMARDQIAKGLESAGVHAAPLVAGDLRRVAYELLNPTRSQTIALTTAAPAWSDRQSAREQLVYSGLTENARSVELDGRLHRVLTLKLLPTWTEAALLESLLVALPAGCRTQLALEMLDTQKAIDGLKRTQDRANVFANSRGRANPEAHAQIQAVADLIDRNLHASIRMVRVALSVVLSVDTAAFANLREAEAVLDRQGAEVLRILSSLHGAQGLVEEYAQLDELLATLPGNALHGRRWHQVTSENASHLVLAWQAWEGARAPSLLLQNGRGNLVGIDPFDAEVENPNAFMAGSSGSGKSVTTNYLLENHIATGGAARIIDRGGSYRRLMDVFGGDYFAVTLDEDHALNPFFDARDIVKDGGRLDEQRQAFLVAVIERMVCDQSRVELRNPERAVLIQALEHTYREARGKTPILSDFVQVLQSLRFADREDAEIARLLSRELRVWVKGPSARLLNRPSTVNLTGGLAAIDLKGLEDPQLQSVVLLVLSGMIWNLVMRDPREKKMIVFDEVWKLLESPASARLVAELYRTSRKYRCSILTISQAVEDFVGSPIAPALVNNSGTVYLLRHKRGHEAITEQFALNARETALFKSLEMRRGEYTEVLVLHGQHHFLARVVLSPLEYWLTTTHPQDLAVERDVRREHPDASRIELLAELAARWPRGVAFDDVAAAAAAAVTTSTPFTTGVSP
jgi:conjugal transfer ATP-binding protein TraC